MVSGFFTRFFNFRNYLIIAIFAIGTLTIFAKHYAFFSFDLFLTRTIQQINLPFFEEVMLLISWMGNFYQSIFSLFIAFLIFTYFKRRDLGIGILVSALGSVFISETLKLIVNRPRPDPHLIHQIEKFTRDDSFPSGHVLFFMGFYGFLLFASYTLIKYKLQRKIFVTGLIILLILIGVSRIYLGSHWFSDTLASYLIGSVWLYIVVLLFRKFKLQSKNDGK